jgi:hypothetical protein
VTAGRQLEFGLARIIDGLLAPGREVTLLSALPPHVWVDRAQEPHPFTLLPRPAPRDNRSAGEVVHRLLEVVIHD